MTARMHKLLLCIAISLDRPVVRKRLDETGRCLRRAS